jgi:shikimate dehydrogenase
VVSGRTELAGVIGNPIRHSLSPVIFNAAFAAAGLDWVFVAFEVGEEDVAAALAGARALGIRGLSVTMPLKSTVVGLVDEASPTASRLGAVNSVRLSETVAGDNTDGDGLLDALRVEAGWEARGRRCAVLGAGGAARAVVLALARAGAADVVVINRSEPSALVAAGLADDVGRVGDPSDVRDAEIVINATSVGMAGTATAAASPLDPALIHDGLVVVDLVYHPLQTLLLNAASARGAVTVGGLGMLVHQAARQFTWWTGHDAPLAEMHAAAVAALRS